jgi:hypothetical protein
MNGRYLQMLLRLIAFAVAITVPTCSGQLKVLDITSVAPDGGVLHECYVDILDSSTLANYASITEYCLQYRNGTEIPDSTFQTQVGAIYGESDTPWQPLDIFEVQTQGYLYMFFNGAYYVDPLGYNGSFLCGPYYPGLNGYPQIQYEWCPNGQYGYITSNSILRYATSSNLAMPVRPYITPSSATVSPSQTIQFTASRLNSSGQQTTVSAQVNWGIKAGSNAGGNINSSGLYTAPTTYSSGTSDTIVATGPICIFCSTAYTATAVATLTPPQGPNITSAIVVNATNNSLQAGPSTQLVTFTGTNFGISNPTITVESGTLGATQGITIDGITSSPSQTSVTFQVTTASDTSAGTVIFQLHANDGSQSPNALSPPVSVVAMVPPPATITFGGASVTDAQGSTPTAVLVGQQIYLTASVPSGIDPTSIDWTVPGTAVAGFVLASDMSTGSLLTQIQTEENNILFYWLFAGNNFKVQYTYCVDVNMQSCASSTATFAVEGPTNVLMAASPGPAELFNLSCADTAYSGPVLSFGDGCESQAHWGMTFNASMDLPANDSQSATFVQLLNFDTVTTIASTGQTQITPPIKAPGATLDTSFPFENKGPFSAYDSPYVRLSDEVNGQTVFDVETKRTFSAVMYLMWFPNVTCNSGPTQNGQLQCAIPVPLGSIQWGFAGDAIDTLQIQNSANPGTSIRNTTSYVLNTCSGCTTPSLTFIPSSPSQPNFGYPTWTQISGN